MTRPPAYNVKYRASNLKANKPTLLSVKDMIYYHSHGTCPDLQDALAQDPKIKP